jgi:hypothetical protein
MRKIVLVLIGLFVLLPLLSVFSNLPAGNRDQTNVIGTGGNLAATLTHDISYELTVSAFNVTGSSSENLTFGSSESEYYTYKSVLALAGSITDAKPCILNGSRYIVATTNGTTTPYPYFWAHPQVYLMDENWEVIKMLSTAAIGVATDLYINVFPTVFDDLIIIGGNFEDGASYGRGFIASFNVTSLAWTWTNTTNPQWITDIIYASCNSSFYINPGAGVSTYTYLYRSSVANLLNVSAWVKFYMPSSKG